MQKLKSSSPTNSEQKGGPSGFSVSSQTGCGATKISFLSHEAAQLSHLSFDSFLPRNAGRGNPNRSPVLPRPSHASSSKLLHPSPPMPGKPWAQPLANLESPSHYYFFSFLTISRQHMLVSTFHSCQPIPPPHRSHKLVPDLTLQTPGLQQRRWRGAGAAFPVPVRERFVTTKLRTTRVPSPGEDKRTRVSLAPDNARWSFGET